MRTAHCDFTQKLLPFNTTLTKFPLLRTPSFFLQPHRMAEPSRAANAPAPHPIQPKPNALADDNNSNKPKEIPPPPEKPEPGDCCGSGCVRCIWDIYYEELEQYNNLHKRNDPSPKPSS